MKNNVYDRFLTEIFFRLSDTTTASLASLTLDISGGITQFVAGYSDSHTFSSTVNNIPVGYTVSANSHTVTTPSGTATGSGSTVTTPSTTIILPLVGNSITITSTVTLVHDTLDDIVLNATLDLAAVTSLYFGVKDYASNPTLTDLTETISTTNEFTLTSTNLGRLLIAIPSNILTPLLSVADNNGLVIPGGNFTTHIDVSGFVIYQLKYNTIFTGNNQKVFKLNFV